MRTKETNPVTVPMESQAPAGVPIGRGQRIKANRVRVATWSATKGVSRGMKMRLINPLLRMSAS